MAGVQWNSLRDFAGFRGVERKPATGRLAVSGCLDMEGSSFSNLGQSADLPLDSTFFLKSFSSINTRSFREACVEVLCGLRRGTPVYLSKLI